MKRVLSSILFIALMLGNTISYADSYYMHRVQPGDTYLKIAKEYNKDVYTLQSINKDLENTLLEGSLMKIAPIPSGKTISIKVNGKKIYTDQIPYLENSRTFVPIRFIAQALNVEEINWDEENQTAILKNKGTTIKLPIQSTVATLNDRRISLDASVSIYQGRTFVPVRFIAEAFDCTVNWDAYNYTVDIKTNNSLPLENPNEEDIYWLSRIVEAEASGESFEGKLAVANVIINRKNSDEFPNSIKEVIFDQNYGYQYTPAMNGTVYNTPSADSINAAKQALQGNNNIGDALYFLNPSASKNFWILHYRTFYKTIENHDFYL